MLKNLNLFQKPADRCSKKLDGSLDPVKLIVPPLLVTMSLALIIFTAPHVVQIFKLTSFKKAATAILAHQKLDQGQNTLGVGENKFTVLERGQRCTNIDGLRFGEDGKIVPLKTTTCEDYALLQWLSQGKKVEVILQRPPLPTPTPH